MNQIHAQIATAPSELADSFNGLSPKKSLPKQPDLRPHSNPSSPINAAKWCLRTLAQRHQTLTTEIETADQILKELIAEQAPPALLQEPGIGPDVAAAIITALGDNPERYTSDAQLARAAGTAPIDASSGRQQRHRLNRGGNRDLNNAIWRIVIVRLRWDQTTKDYITKRTSEGKTKKEAIRCHRIYQNHHKNIPTPT